ncbi:MAG: sugar phosphate isomerase/epimerase family protein [Candidatus Hydrogenedentota bacterium]
MTKVSRRNFIVTGAAAAGAAWLARPALAQADQEASREEYGGFEMSLQTNILSQYTQDLDEIIELTADFGLYWIEFANWHYEATDDEDRIEEVQAKLEPHEMQMESYFLGDITGDDEAAHRATFEFARRNGAPVLVGQPAEETFPILDQLVREYEDMRVAIHNYGPGAQYDYVEDMIVAAAPWDWRIGYCLDTGHLMRTGEDPVEAVRRLGTRLHGIHLREHESVTRQEDLPETIVGEGALDLEAFCRALRDVNFVGPLSLEIYYDPADPVEPIRQSLANFAEAARATA